MRQIQAVTGNGDWVKKMDVDDAAPLSGIASMVEGWEKRTGFIYRLYDLDAKKEIVLPIIDQS